MGPRVSQNATFKRLARRPGLVFLCGLLLAAMLVPVHPAQAVDCTMTEDGNGDLILSSDCTIPAGTYSITRDFVVASTATVTAAGNTTGGTGVVISAGRDITIESGGVLTADAQGYAGETGPGAGNHDTTGNSGSGAGHGGEGGQCGGGNAGGDAYGDATAPVTEPAELGSGGGDDTNTGGMQGGTGGGAIKLTASSGTITVDGTVSADGGGAINSSHDGGGGSGGSVWLAAASVAGSGTVSADGGSAFSNQGGGGGAGGRIAITYSNTDASSWTVTAHGGAGGNQSSYNGQDGGAGTVFRQGPSGNGDLYVRNNDLLDRVATPLVELTTWTFDNITLADGARLRVPGTFSLELATGGTFTASGTETPRLDIESGASYRPNTTTINYGDLTWDVAGTIYDATNFTVSGSDFYDYGATFDAGLSDLTIGSGGYYYLGSTGSSGLDNITVADGGTLVQTVTGAVTIGNLTVESGGTVTHGDNSTAKSNEVNLSATGDIDIQSGGVVDVDGLGYDRLQGTGKGSNGGGGGGGGHGGDGTGAYDDGGAAGGGTYGSVTQPSTMGSGGGSDSNYGCCGGYGGGVIKMAASGTLTVNGTVSADGTVNHSGGAGGSVWLDAATLAGTGTVTANGGDASHNGGSGGGGRVAVYYTNGDPDNWSVQARGGDGGNLDGGAGTVYLKGSGATNGDLRVDNLDYIGDDTTQVSSTSQYYDNVSIVNGARYIIPTGCDFGLANTATGTLTTGGTQKPSVIIDGGTFYPPHSSGSYTLSNLDVDLQNSGSIAGWTDLTLNNVDFNHTGGGFASNLQGLTVNDSSTFYFTTTNTYSLGNVTINSNGIFEQAVLGSVSMTNLTIASGGTVRHAANSSSKAYEVNVSASGNIDIQSGGAISVASRGLTSGGTGAGTNSGAGAGHGGDGGDNASAGGPSYGSVTQPTDLGSKGYNGGYGGGAVKLVASGTLTVDGTISANGSGVSCVYGIGGGAGGSVWLDAGTLDGDGTITANGGSYGCSGNMGGGGGGGRIAVYYTTDSSTLISSGNKLQAYGGYGYGATKGGAGSIYLDDKDDSLTDGSVIYDNNNQSNSAYTSQTNTSSQYFNEITIRNGASYRIPSGYTFGPSSSTDAITTGGTAQPSITVDGGTFDPPHSSGSYTLTNLDMALQNSGTIADWQYLTLDNADFTHTDGSFSSSLSTLTIGDSSTFAFATTNTHSLTNVTVNNGGTLEQRMLGAFSTANLTIASGGTVRHAANSSSKAYEVNVSASGNIDIQSGGTISLAGRGFTSGGPGAGTNTAAGAGHGGDGGDDGTSGGPSYGSVTQPTDLGSKGRNGGNGGGAVKLVASGTLTVDGTINVNGNNSNTAYGLGGGSGGSVWLDAGTLDGDGTVTANGGSGGSGGGNTGGGGAGGRIAVYYTTDSSSLISGNKLQAYGGAGNWGGTYGGGGSLYLSGPSSVNGDLIVGNNNTSNSAPTTQATTASQTYDAVTVKDGAKYVVPDGYTLTVASGGSLTGSGTQDPSLTVQSGGTLSLVDVTTDSGSLNMSNSGSLALSGHMTLSSGTFNAVGTITGGLSTLTVESGGNFIYTSTSPLFSGSDLIIENGGTFTQDNTTTLEVDTLRVETGGTLTHSDNSTSKDAMVNISATTVEIQSGAYVDADGLGYDGSEDGGNGGAGGDAAAGGGGGYGGAGGAGYVGGASQSNGGSTYGTSADPDYLGSGGGDDTGGGSGGAGGGAIKIIASGTMTVNGSVSADGAAGASNQAGGGAGGSVWLEAGTWAGSSGTITADGGAGSGNDTDGGGCGGGGRAYVLYTTKTYTGSSPTAATGCSGVRAGSAGTATEAANAPTITSIYTDPASPFTDTPVTIYGEASYSNGDIDEMGIYLDGDFVGGCVQNPAQSTMTCGATVGLLSRGSHSVEVKAYGTDATEGSDTDTFTVAGYTTTNRPILSRLKAGETGVDFTLEFDLPASSTGTLEVTFPSGFTVTQAPSAGSSSACLSGFDAPDAQTMTATKTDCNGTVTLAGGQVTNPASPGQYTITWTNDNGEGDVYITDDDQVSVTSNVDPKLTFDIDIGSSCGSETSTAYTVDLGALAAGTVKTATDHICLDLDTNAAGGATVQVKGTNAGLYSATASHTLSTAYGGSAVDLSSQSEGFGVCVAATSVESGKGSITAAAPYDGACDTGTGHSVGGISTSFQDLAGSGGAPVDGVANSAIDLLVKAVSATTSPAAPNYQEILTFIAAATF